jgi:hypothetical protein
MGRGFLIMLGVMLCASAAWWYWPRPAEPLRSVVSVPQKRLAPDGTFFLLDAVSIKTAFGIDGLSPGTAVHRTKQNGTHVTVTNGEHEFDVDQRQLTNDLDRVQAIRHQYNTVQTSVNNDILRRQNEHARQQQLEAKASDEEEARLQQLQKQRAVTAPNTLERGPYHQTDAHHYEYDWSGRRYWIDSSGHRHYAAPE